MITFNGQKLTCSQMREMGICSDYKDCSNCIAFVTPVTPKQRFINAGKQFLANIKANLAPSC